MIQKKIKPSCEESSCFIERLKERAGRKFLVMGILNITPDSFSDGGKYVDSESAVARALEMWDEGADIIDVGAESSRPGSFPVSSEKQLQRVAPVIALLKERNPEMVISIDTSSRRVAEKAADVGADLINDISAFRNDPDMRTLAVERDMQVILMHMQGSPLDMQNNPEYEDVCREICDFLKERIDYAVAGGVSLKNITIDPGFGFGKNLKHNLKLLQNLDLIKDLGCPLLVGLSRKRMIGDILGVPVNERMNGSIVMNVLSMVSGADILRVHDVYQTVQAAVLADAVLSGKDLLNV